MNKGIVYLAVAAVIGAGAYYGVQYSKQSNSTNSLAYVPASTMLFIGDKQPVSWQDSILPMQSRFTQLFTGASSSSLHELEKLQADIKTNPDQWNDGLKILVGIYSQYVTAVTKSDFKPDTIGLADKIDASIYTVGALPVFRFKINNEVNFDKFIQTAAEKTGAKAETAKFKELSYQRYWLAKDKHPTAIAIAKKDGFAIITLDLGTMIPEQDFSVAMGLEKPKQSLADAGTLNQLTDKYGLVSHSLGFIDNQALIKTLTRADSPLAKLLEQLSDGEVTTKLASFRTPDCQKDIESISALWPREIFGYTKFDVSSNPKQLTSVLKFESTDQATMTSLQKLRGFIPHSKETDNSLLSFGVGLNVEQLAPVVTDLWTRYTQAKFTCPALVESQNSLKETNPAMLAMGTAMVQGLQGVNVDLLKLKLKKDANGQPDVEQLSLVASVSAKQPQQIWSLLGMVNPEMASAIQLPADGQSVDLPVPPVVKLPQPVKLGLYGQHIAIFTGDEGAKAATALSAQKLEQNGFYRMKLDYGFLADIAVMGKDNFKQLEDAAEQNAEQSTEGGNSPDAASKEKDLDQAIQVLNQLRGMHLSTGMDFDKDGVALDGSITIDDQKK